MPAREEAATAAEALAGAYLDYWSAPNAVTLDATPDFYAPRVEFHGRLLSARALFEEKKRFVRRWPERRYTPRPDTLRTACDPGTGNCVVKTVFDFIAANPARRRRSQGTGTLELVVSVAGQQPVIIAETSRILRRGEPGATPPATTTRMRTTSAHARRNRSRPERRQEPAGAGSGAHPP